MPTLCRRCGYGYCVEVCGVVCRYVWCRVLKCVLSSVQSLRWTLLQNIVSFIGLFCKRDPQFFLLKCLPSSFCTVWMCRVPPLCRRRYYRHCVDVCGVWCLNVYCLVLNCVDVSCVTNVSTCLLWALCRCVCGVVCRSVYCLLPTRMV